MPPAPNDVVLDPDRLASRLAALPAAAGLKALRDGTRPVYLVGGGVRDLALGRTPAELDLMVEGNADEVAYALAGGQTDAVRTFPRFGTATVTLGGHAYDVAGARRERYAAPGMLPQVEPAAAEQDLRRRDFTVNAIALGIGGPVRGRLLSAPGARDDLVAGRLRVLHPASFRDDPTRLLRLARYAARLGFAPEPDTRAWAAEAIGAGALESVSGPRIGAELVLLAADSDPVDALGVLGDLGAGPALAAGFGLADPDAVRRALKLLPDDADPALTVLGAAVLDVPGSARDVLLEWLGLAAGRRDGIRATARDARSLATALSTARRPSEIDRAVAGASAETTALAGGLDPAAEPSARAWLRELRHVTLQISGDDLIAAGIPAGPGIGAGLAAARGALLDGRAPEHDAQLAEALRAAVA